MYPAAVTAHDGTDKLASSSNSGVLMAGLQLAHDRHLVQKLVSWLGQHCALLQHELLNISYYASVC